MNVETALLGLLGAGDLSGYGLKKALGEEAGLFFGPTGHGAIYPALHRLEERALVSGCWVAQSGRPDKKVYSITAAGRRFLRERLAEGREGARFWSTIAF